MCELIQSDTMVVFDVGWSCLVWMCELIQCDTMVVFDVGWSCLV